MIQALQRSEMDANWAAARKERAAVPAPAPQNVQTVLDLGNAKFFLFRGLPFGVPPLPWKAGARLLALVSEARSFAGVPLTPDSAPRYYAVLQQLPALLWRHTRPVGLGRRVLHALGVLRNPFAVATERELVDLADHFLALRMTSGVSFPSVTDQPARATS